MGPYLDEPKWVQCLVALEALAIQIGLLVTVVVLLILWLVSVL